MCSVFDHERLKVYQEALRFVAWVGPLIEEWPARLSAKDQLEVHEESSPYGAVVPPCEKEKE